MKNRNWIISLSMLIILAVTACAAQPTAVPQPTQANAQEVETAEPAEMETEAPEVETEVEAETQPAAPAQPAAQATPMTEEQMLAMLTEKLKGSPHTVEFILSQTKTAEEWSVTLDRMIGKGAKINAEEKQILITWLVNR